MNERERQLLPCVLSLTLLVGVLGLLAASNAGAVPVLHTQRGGTWRAYINGNEVNDLLVEGNVVWAATQGGVVRWDRTDGSYVKYTTLDGLADNQVYAVAGDSAGHKWFGTRSGVSEYDGSTWTT